MEMKATWIDGMRFAYQSASGNGLITDAPTEHGGTGTAATPMELVLLGLIGCTGVDVVSILHKMKQPVDHLSVRCLAERADKHPKVYTKIHLIYEVEGDVDEKKLERAIHLSESTYCSVSAMLSSTAEITNEYRLNKD